MAETTTKKTRVATDKFEEAVGRFARLKKRAEKAKEALEKEAKKLAPFETELAEATEELEKLRDRIKKFVVDRKTDRYTCRYGLVEKVNGQFKVTDFDLDVLPIEFIKRSPEKKKIIDHFKAHDNTPPEGAKVERGEMSVKITV